MAWSRLAGVFFRRQWATQLRYEKCLYQTRVANNTRCSEFRWASLLRLLNSGLLPTSPILVKNERKEIGTLSIIEF